MLKEAKLYIYTLDLFTIHKTKQSTTLTVRLFYSGWNILSAQVEENGEPLQRKNLASTTLEPLELPAS
jgi:hypothetical protein